MCIHTHTQFLNAGNDNQDQLSSRGHLKYVDKNTIKNHKTFEGKLL